MAFKQLWFWKPRQLTDKWAEVHAFSTDEFERPSIVVSENKPTISESIWFGSIDANENLFINWRDGEVMGFVPPLWYFVQEVNRPFPGGPEIPFVFLYAMHGPDFDSGTIVTAEKLKAIGKIPTDSGVGESETVGFVQWFKDSSKIQQILVYEKWRRKRVTLALFGVADLVIVSGSYGQFLNGGDITTPDGETLRSAWSGSARLLPRIGSVVEQKSRDSGT